MADLLSTTATDQIKYEDDEIMILNGGGLVHFEPKRSKTVMGKYVATEGANGQKEYPIVFWGDRNTLPDDREYLLANNNIVPQIIRAKRDIILGGGVMAYRERFEDGPSGQMRRIIDEVPMPPAFAEFMEMNEELYGGLADRCNDLLKHGNYFVEAGRLVDEQIYYLKHHAARCVRAQKQNSQGRIPNYWVYGSWSKVKDIQKMEEVKDLTRISAFNPTGAVQGKFMLHYADKLLGGPYYYDPHYAGSEMWIKVANAIPVFHHANLENGFNIRYLGKIPTTSIPTSAKLRPASRIG